MADLIDDLKVQIEASTQNADGKLDKFIAKMMKLQSTITGLEMSNVSNIASGINQISASIQSFNTRTKTSDFTKVASGMNKLSGVDAQGISNASRAMSTLAANLTGLDHISFDADGITKMADSLVKLGGKQVTEATQNLEFLKTSLADFIGGMNGIEGLTFNQKGLADLVKSVNGLGSKYATQSADNLPKLAANLKSFITEMSSIDGVTFSMPGLEDLVGNITRLGNVKSAQAVKNLKPIKEQLLRFISGLNGIKTVDFDTDKLTNLVASISKLGGKAATNAIPNIQQLGVALKDMMKTLSGAPAVNQNLINMTNALANLAGKGLRVSSVSTAMYKGLGMYSSGAKSATKHSFNLASAIGKVYATYWALLRAFGTIRKSIGIAADLTEVQNVIDVSFGAMSSMVEDFTSTSVQKFGMSELAAKKMSGVFMAMGKSLGAPQKEMAEMSIELTKLAADMASFYNVEQDAVGEDLQSVFTGTVRPLRDYGLDLTQANLQQYAFSQGIQKSVRDMTQLEKVQLRYNYVMANTAHIQGDYARTSMTWSNQVRLLGQQFQQLGGIVGGTMINAFKPFLQAMNQVIAKIISVAKAISDALGKIFGWQYQVSGGGAGMAGITGDLDDAAGAADDLAGGAGGAADKLGDAAKNAKKLAGNLQSFDHLNVISSKDDSSRSGGGAGVAAGNFGEWVPAETIWEKYKSSIDSLYELGKYIGDTLTSAMNNIDWDGVYAKAEGFGRGLANFLNGLISPELFGATGRTIAGCLNTALHFLDSFGTTFDWKDFGNSIAAGINGFFNKFDFNLLVSTFNTWAIGLLDTMATAIGKTDWKIIGEKVGDAIEKLDWKGILKGVGEVFWASFNAAIDLTSELFGIPKSTASTIIGSIGGMVLALQGFGGLGKAIGKLEKIYGPLGNLFSITKGVKYLAIAGGIAGLVLALDKFGGIKVNWKSLGNSFEEFASALGKFTKGIGQGLINFIDGISDVISPILATTVYAIGGAFDTFASVMNSIPESVISSVTETLLNLFMGFKTYQLVVKAGGLITMFADNIRLFASVLPGIFNSGPILKNLAAALGPTALGGIQFTVIATGIYGIARALIGLYDSATETPELDAWDEEFDRALSNINDNIDNLKRKLDELNTSVDESGQSQTATAQKLADEYLKLKGKVEPTNKEILLMKQYSQELVDYYPELKTYFDDEKGLLEINREELQKTIDKQKELARAKAAMSSMEEAYQIKFDAETQYNDSLAEAEKAEQVFEQASKAKENYLEAHPTYAQTGTHSLFEGDPFGTELTKINKALTDSSINLENAKSALKESSDLIQDSNASIDKFWGIYNESTIAATENSSEFKESVDRIKSGFDGLGIAITQGYAAEISSGDSSVMESLNMLFTNMEHGISASAEELKALFKKLGIDLPDSLSESLASKSPDLQSQASTTLISMRSGVSASEEELAHLFSAVGLRLPEEAKNSLASKNGTLQLQTIETLGKIEEGHSASQPELIALFGSLGNILPDELMKSLASKDSDVQSQAVQLLSQIPSASDQERDTIIENLNNLGIDGAESLEKGIEDQIESTSTMSKNLVTAVSSAATDEFTSTTSGAMYDAGANASKGFWQGIKDWWDDSWMGRKINELKNAVAGRDGLDEHSPSKIMGQYGAFAGIGFNREFQTEMDKTVPMVERWMENIKAVYSGYSIAFPGSDVSYSFNTDFIDRFDNFPKVSVPDFGASSMSVNYTSDITASLKGSNEELLYELKRNNDLLEQILEKPSIDDDGIYRATQRGVAKNFYRTGKTGLKGVD